MGILTHLMAYRAQLLLARSERGASLVEYALLVALISVVCVAAMSTFGGAVDSNFASVSNLL